MILVPAVEGGVVVHILHLGEIREREDAQLRDLILQLRALGRLHRRLHRQNPDPALLGKGRREAATDAGFSGSHPPWPARFPSDRWRKEPSTLVGFSRCRSKRQSVMEPPVKAKRHASGFPVRAPLVNRGGPVW